MKQDWLDKNLGDKLDGYDSPMDLENAWELLQTKRQAPKKKNKFFFFWFISGLFILGVVGSYLFLNKETHNNTIAKLEQSVENKNPRFGKTEMSSSTLLNSKIKTQQNDNKNVAAKTKTIQNEIKNRSLENQNYSNSKKAKTNVDSNSSFSDLKNNNVITSEINLDFPKKSNDNFISPKENKNEEKNITVIDSTSSQKEIQPLAVLFLPTLEPNLLSLSPQKEFEILNGSYANHPVIYPSAPSISNYFGIVGGYGIHTKGQVLSQENSLDAITINAFYEHRFGRTKWFFKTGINYDQFIKKIETTTLQAFSEGEDNQLITVNHFQNGTVQNIYGVGDVSKVEKTTSKNFNRYRLISIPMILGYDLISLNKASLQIEGGVARSIFGFHSGKDFDLIDSDFEKRGVWQGIYGLNFNLSTGERTNIFTSFKGNYHFNKIGKSDQLNIEKFRLHQIQVGLRFKL